MIKLLQVSKEYQLNDGVLKVLKNINLSLNKGEFTALLGPSGSGKSTLMHIIGLLDVPSHGHIMFEERDIAYLSDGKVSQLRNEAIGFVFQQFNLINKLTVLENILLPTVYSRHKLVRNPKKSAFDLMERFAISEKADQFPNSLSGGQQQRVAIARALINNPRLILADEPTGNLDTVTGKKILSLLKELNEKDILTILLVTHEKDVANYASKKIKIRDGQIVTNLNQTGI